MKCMRLVVPVLACAVLSACAASDKAGLMATMEDGIVYRESNWWNLAGYESKQLSADRYEVTVSANTVSRTSRTMGVTLVRIADMAKENGFAYFTLEKFDVGMKCFSTRTGGSSVSSPHSGWPLIKAIGKAGSLEEFAGSARVFSVAKIDANLKPKMSLASASHAQKSATVLANRRRCKALSAAEFLPPGSADITEPTPPWEAFDILVDVPESAES